MMMMSQYSVVHRFSTKALNDRQGMNYCVWAAEFKWMPREAFCVHLAASNGRVTVCLTKNTINQTTINIVSNFAYRRVQSRGNVYLDEANRNYK
jgi:hypothetical protein